MDGLFKKTMSYLNSEGVVQDEFVGKIVEVAAIKLKILRKIAEGEEENFLFFVVIFPRKPSTMRLNDKQMWVDVKIRRSENFLAYH